jgi:sugar lactone lactonase YvrE
MTMRHFHLKMGLSILTRRNRTTALSRVILTALAIACAGQAAASPTEIVIEGANTFPENITSTRDGTIITGSVGSGGIFKAAPGATVATQWIAPGDNGLLDTFGVLADEASDTLWVCSSSMDPPVAGEPPAVPALYRYHLDTGAFRSKHSLPGRTGLCNDIAIGPDRAAYVADTTGGRILRLRDGGETLEEWSKSAELEGADGLDFQERQLFVNSFTTGKLFRIELKPDGTAGTPVTLTTSRQFIQPDGLRRLNDTQFVMAEGSGTVDLLTVRGDTVEVETIRSGLIGPAGVTIIGDTIWALESKLSMRGQYEVNPAPFKAYAVPAPGH